MKRLAAKNEQQAFFYENLAPFTQDAPPLAALSWQVWHLIAQTPLVRGMPPNTSRTNAFHDETQFFMKGECHEKTSPTRQRVDE